QLSYAGFSGIYINRKGYPDRGAGLEKNLTTLLKQSPMVSQDGNLAFYPITNYAKQLRQLLPEHVWDKKVRQVKEIGFFWGKGWGPLEKSGHSSWRWSLKRERSILDIATRGQSPIKIRLQAEFGVQSASSLDLVLSG